MENTLRRLTGRHLFAAPMMLLALTVLGAPLIRGQVREEAPRLSFTAEFEGLEAGRFHEVSGLSIEVQVIEFSEGGNNNFIHKLPGRVKYPNLVLKRGFTGDLALYNWANAKALTGDVIRRSGVIAMFNQTGAEVARYRIEDAWPTKWTGPTLQASKNEVAIETLEIAHVGFRRDDD